MITINDLLARQEEFDKSHSSNFQWNEKISDDNIVLLEHLMLALVGEFGEAANIIKKVVRGDATLLDVKEQLSEEVIDILIYTLKLIYQLDIDIETAYNKKVAANTKRFAKYKK